MRHRFSSAFWFCAPFAVLLALWAFDVHAGANVTAVRDVSLQ